MKKVESYRNTLKMNTTNRTKTPSDQINKMNQEIFDLVPNYE